MFVKSYDANDDTITVDGSNLTNGFYFLKVKVDGVAQPDKKIIK
jgi:hypothetical protein